MSDNYALYPLNYLAQEIFDVCCKRIGFLGALLIGCDDAHKDFECLLGFSIPISPFNGNDRNAVSDALRVCYTTHSVPHIHNISNLSLGHLAKKHGSWGEGTRRIWFHPFQINNRHLILIGFLKPGDSRPTIPLDALIVRSASVVIHERELFCASNKLHATERFVREVGHDFAVSVQAVIAKVHTAKKTSLSQESRIRKLEEIETEIKGAYKQAEQLGITIDSTYNKRNQSNLTLLDVVIEVIEQLKSEASERKIIINKPTSRDPASTKIYGDKVAVTICVMQVVHNAIKYSFEDTRIDVEFSGDSEFVHLIVSNVGHPLPTGEEEDKIFDLGFRGENAKSLHVNGSGVGLFTVSKIVRAHFGTCTGVYRPGKTTFTIKLPRLDIEKNKVGNTFRPDNIG